MNETVIRATTVEQGSAHGMPLALAAPLSFWGGYDAAQGAIVEPGHPNRGAAMGGKVLLMARSKGSSSSSSVLAEAIRNGTGPAAIVMLERDLIVALGAIVARELYGIVVPMVVAAPGDWERVQQADGELFIEAAASGQASIRWQGNREKV